MLKQIKRKIFYSLAVVALAAFSTVNVLNSRAKSVVSDLRLANVAALADEAGSGESGQQWGCAGNPTFIPNETLVSVSCKFLGFISTQKTHKVCDSKDNVCCDPAGQTDCGGSKKEK